MNRKLSPVSLSAIILGAGLVAGAAQAQSAQPAEGAQTNQPAASVEAVIVNGRRPVLNQVPIEAPYTESVITPEAILNITPSPAMTVQTLLNTQPSIYATTGGTNGMETNIKFRSFSDGEFGETVAGVPLNDIFNSGVTYQADNRNNVLFITRDLDSVEIFRGVNNPAVNTYNSLGGTINYIPRQPTATAGGDIGVDGGSFDTVDYHLTLNTGDWHGIRQTASFERDYSSGWLRNTPDWNDNVYYAATADIDRKTKVFLDFVYNKNHGDAPQYIPENIINKDYSYQFPNRLYQASNLDTNLLGILGATSQLNDMIKVENEFYGGLNDYTRTSFSNSNYSGPYYLDDQGEGYAFWSSYASYAPGNAGFDQFGSTKAATDYHFYGYEAYTLGDRVQLSFDLPLNRVTVGGDYNVGELHSREYWYGNADVPQIVGYNDAWDEHDTRQMWSAYAQDDIHVFGDRIHITPGVKYIHAASKDNDALGFYYSDPGADRADEHFLSPTLGVNFQLMKNLAIYGSYGKNVKFPDITAFYNAIAGSDTPPIVVRPENAQDFEAGARYKWRAFQIEANYYNEHFTHIIESATTATGFTQYQNGGSEDFNGVEAQLTGDLGQVLGGGLKGYLNASYNSAICSTVSRDDLAGTSCNPGQALPNVPRQLATVGLIWDVAKWHVDLQGQYVGPQQLTDGNTSLPGVAGDIQPGQATHIPDYFLLNLGVIKVIPVTWGPMKALRLAFHADNLLDKRWFSSAQTNSDANNATNPATGNQLLDFYGLAGEPRAFFGSVSAYF